MKNESDLEDDKENDVLDQDSVRMIKRFEKELILFNMYKKIYAEEQITFEEFIEEIVNQKQSLPTHQILYSVKELTLKGEILFEIFKHIGLRVKKQKTTQKRAVFYMFKLLKYLPEFNPNSDEEILEFQGTSSNVSNKRMKNSDERPDGEKEERMVIEKAEKETKENVNSNNSNWGKEYFKKKRRLKERESISYPKNAKATQLVIGIENFEREKNEFYNFKMKNTLKMMCLHCKRRLRYRLAFAFYKYRDTINKIKYYQLISVENKTKNALLPALSMESDIDKKSDKSLSVILQKDKSIDTSVFIELSEFQEGLNKRTDVASLFGGEQKKPKKKSAEIYHNYARFETFGSKLKQKQKHKKKREDENYSNYKQKIINKLHLVDNKDKRESSDGDYEGEDSGGSERSPEDRRIGRQRILFILLKYVSNLDTMHSLHKQKCFYKWYQFSQNLENTFLALKLEEVSQYIHQFHHSILTKEQHLLLIKQQLTHKINLIKT